jgi:hypothetical protein
VNDQPEQPTHRPVFMARSQFRKKFEEYLKKLTPEELDDHRQELLAFAGRVESRFGGREMTAKVASGEISAAEAIERAQSEAELPPQLRKKNHLNDWEEFE